MSSNIAQRFAGKVAFVTGATSGIGQATAIAFAREGASVVVVDIAEEGVQKTARLIEQAGSVCFRSDKSELGGSMADPRPNMSWAEPPRPCSRMIAPSAWASGVPAIMTGGCVVGIVVH